VRLARGLASCCHTGQYHNGFLSSRVALNGVRKVSVHQNLRRYPCVVRCTASLTCEVHERTQAGIMACPTGIRSTGLMKTTRSLGHDFRDPSEIRIKGVTTTPEYAVKWNTIEE
jgi:hypothetical protein